MIEVTTEEIEDHALKVEISRARSLLIYNITLHKIPRLVKCPDTRSTGAPASVSESRGHQQNDDFVCGPCIRTDLPLSKALRNRRLANGLWIPQPPTGHSRAACVSVSWCSKGKPWMLCFMKRSFGIFAGLACQRTNCDTHLTTDEAAQLDTVRRGGRPARPSRIDLTRVESTSRTNVQMATRGLCIVDGQDATPPRVPSRSGRQQSRAGPSRCRASKITPGNVAANRNDCCKIQQFHLRQPPRQHYHTDRGSSGQSSKMSSTTWRS